MTKNYKKDISSITTPIKFHLPDGSTIPFENSAKALLWFNKNYGNGYSMVEYTPTQGAFRRLSNGRYQYEGPILPDKTIRVQTSPSRSIYDDYDFELFKLGGTLNPVEKFKKLRKRYIK